MENRFKRGDIVKFNSEHNCFYRVLKSGKTILKAIEFEDGEDCGLLMDIEVSPSLKYISRWKPISAA